MTQKWVNKSLMTIFFFDIINSITRKRFFHKPCDSVLVYTKNKDMHETAILFENKALKILLRYIYISEIYKDIPTLIDKQLDLILR